MQIEFWILFVILAIVACFISDKKLVSGIFSFKQVNPYRLPWDFYINQQLKMRLGSQFNKYFGHNQCCYLFDNCCVTVDQDKGSRTIKVSVKFAKQNT